MLSEGCPEGSVGSVAGGGSLKVEFVELSTSACIGVVANDRVVVENSKTVGRTQVVYVFGLGMSNPVPGKLAMADASDEASCTLDAVLWLPDLSEVSAVSAGTTD